MNNICSKHRQCYVWQKERTDEVSWGRAAGPYPWVVSECDVQSQGLTWRDVTSLDKCSHRHQQQHCHVVTGVYQCRWQPYQTHIHTHAHTSSHTSSSPRFITAASFNHKLHITTSSPLLINSLLKSRGLKRWKPAPERLCRYTNKTVAA